MKKIKHLMIWIGLLLSLVSCKDTMEAIGLGGDEIPAEGLVLNIDLPNFSEKQLGTRADATESINSLTAVFYGKSNTYIGMAKDPKLTQKETGKYQVTISNIPAGTTTVHLVTNVNDLSVNEAKDLQDITKATSRPIDTSSPICWGSISVKSLLEGNATVSLLRQYAKVTLKVADAVKGVFPEENAGLIIKHTAAKSAIAPVGYSDPTSDPTYALPATTEYSSTEVGDGTSREVAVTEAPAGEANIIIKASYKGKDGFKDGFYKVALYKDEKKNSEYALLRNHNYTITVTKVNDYGFSTLDEAINSKPENRLEAEIIDDNPDITKMIACKDYELGVSDDLSVKATAAVATEAIKATITVTTLKSATSADDKLLSINYVDSWITFDKDKDVIETKLPELGSKSSPGKKYVLTFTLAPNNKSEDPRTGTVTISSGDLKLDVKITQAGFDFRRDDPKRKVTMLIDNNVNTENYFEWLDKNMQGIRPEQMLGNVRNNGFHFAIGKNTYSYKIPYLEDDKLTDTDDHFKVEKVGDFWEVTLTDNRDDNYDLWQGNFTITNKEGIKITYYVYHTGIFHEITDDMAEKYELAEGGDENLKVKGWFYYGVVKVKGKAHTYIMLDRNLGATDNSPYAPDVNELKDHKSAIGGYFKISEYKNTSDVKQGNLSSTLSPKGFEIPEKSVFEDLIAIDTLKTEVRHTALGESYYCTYMNTTNSELKTIYLPYGGYLEGQSLKNPMHVILWTKSLLSGTQGFSESGKEYGYWYNYFNVYNSKQGISNVRFVSGSNGNNTGRYKAMPLRLVRVLQ